MKHLLAFILLASVAFAQEQTIPPIPKPPQPRAPREPAPIDPYAFVVRVGGASGVNVDPSGLVLTVKHVEAPPQCPITFPSGETYTGTRVYTTSEDDGPDVFRLANVSTPLPYVKLAAGIPQPGDAATAIGYPVGKPMLVRSGRFMGGGPVAAWDGRRYRSYIGNHLDFDMTNGCSGGPVLSDGNLVGLIASGNGTGLSVISWTATKQAVDTAMRKPVPAVGDRKILYVFGYPACGPCRAWDADFPTIEGLQIVHVTWANGRWDKPEVIAAMRASVTLPLPADDAIPCPTFWISGCAKYNSGYRAGQRQTFLGWLFGCGCWNRPTPAPQPTPAPPLEPIPDLGPPVPPPPTDDVRAELEQLKAQLAALIEAGGVQGPPGRDGKDGGPGPQGPPGEPGTLDPALIKRFTDWQIAIERRVQALEAKPAATIDTAAILEQLKSEASITVEFEAGDESDEPARTVKIPYGGTLTIPPVVSRIAKDGKHSFDSAPLGQPIKLRFGSNLTVTQP